jgi:MarR family transcriptional regulator, organic hydroperoxide resistance regulator
LTGYPLAVSPRKSSVRAELQQRRPFRSPAQEAAIALLRTAAVVRRSLARAVEPAGLSLAQYNVLRILRGAGSAGLPTLAIRDRMIEDAAAITRLVDKLERSGLVRRERSTPDRRQVICHPTPKALALLERLDASVDAADVAATEMLSAQERRELVRLLDAIRAGHRAEVPS